MHTALGVDCGDGQRITQDNDSVNTNECPSRTRLTLVRLTGQASCKIHREPPRMPSWLSGAVLHRGKVRFKSGPATLWRTSKLDRCLTFTVGAAGRCCCR